MRWPASLNPNLSHLLLHGPPSLSHPLPISLCPDVASTWGHPRCPLRQCPFTGHVCPRSPDPSPAAVEALLSPDSSSSAHQLSREQPSANPLSSTIKTTRINTSHSPHPAPPPRPPAGTPHSPPHWPQSPLLPTHFENINQVLSGLGQLPGLLAHLTSIKVFIVTTGQAGSLPLRQPPLPRCSSDLPSGPSLRGFAGTVSWA